VFVIVVSSLAYKCKGCITSLMSIGLLIPKKETGAQCRGSPAARSHDVRLSVSSALMKDQLC